MAPNQTSSSVTATTQSVQRILQRLLVDDNTTTATYTTNTPTQNNNSMTEPLLPTCPNNPEDAVVSTTSPIEQLNHNNNNNNNNNQVQELPHDGAAGDDHESQFQQHLEVSNIPTTTTTTTTTSTSNRSSSSSMLFSSWRKNILAFSSTTNCVATILIPILIISTHILFIYGQTSDMWSLLLHTNVNVQYKAMTYESQFTLDALKLPRSDQYNIPNQNHIVRTFTYIYAMQELWQAKHMPGLFLPRLASAGLFLFSGIWPHLKLILLNITWFTPYTNHQRRQRMLSYLSVLGKWSLVDVLVVCVMVGVLHLRYTFTTQHVMDMIQSHLHNVVTIVHTLYNDVQVCSMALKYSCDHPKNIYHIADCSACRNLVSTWFNHPDSVRDILKGIETSGGGEVQLSVVGLHGIYAFCGAVIASILLSFVVDYYDFKCRTNGVNDMPQLDDEEEHIVETINAEVTLPTETNTTSNEDCDDAILNQLLLAAENGNHSNRRSSSSSSSSSSSRNRRIDTRSMADRDFDRTIRIENNRSTHSIWQVISWLTLILVISATIAITMERRVYGAIPMLLQETFDVVWTKQYNFIWLAYTTALAGQWDYLLMGTFVWFVIAGPILRALLCVIASRYNETSTMTDAAIVALYRTKRHLSTWIDFIGAFCAWEVFAVAVLMVDLLMPSITSTILIDPRCAQIISTNTTGTDSKNSNCFEVEFDIMKKTFWMVVTGGVVLLLVSQNIRNNLHKTER